MFEHIKGKPSFLLVVFSGLTQNSKIVLKDCKTLRKRKKCLCYLSCFFPQVDIRISNYFGWPFKATIDDWVNESPFIKLFQVTKPYPVTPELYQSCLRYTLTARISPNWNKVGEWLIQGRDFLTHRGAVNAVSKLYRKCFS